LQAADLASVVLFTGVAQETTSIASGGLWPLRTRFQVRERFWGTGVSAPSELEVATSIVCGASFAKGQEYVVRANRGKDGILKTGMCSFHLPATEAKTELLYLRGVSERERGFSVLPRYLFGSVTYEPGSSWRSIPVSGVRIEAGAENGAVLRTDTDDAGRFAFFDPPEGLYEVRASGRGTFLPSSRQAAATACAEVSFTATRNRVEGALLEADGEPSGCAVVELLPVAAVPAIGVPRAQVGHSGRYVFAVPPGRYSLRARLPGESVPVYYPHGEGEETAGIIDLAPGPEATREGRWKLPDRVTLMIEGTVAQPDGTPVAGAVVDASLREANAGGPEPGCNRSLTDNDGRFRLRLPPRRYTLRAQCPGAVDGSRAVEVGSPDLRVQAVQLQCGR